MAKATYDTETVTRTVEDKRTVVRLTLSLDEAQALHAVLRNVGGKPEKGRKHTDTVLKELDRVGGIRSGRFEMSGSVYFGNPYADPGPFTFSPSSGLTIR